MENKESVKIILDYMHSYHRQQEISLLAICKTMMTKEQFEKLAENRESITKDYLTHMPTNCEIDNKNYWTAWDYFAGMKVPDDSVYKKT